MASLIGLRVRKMKQIQSVHEHDEKGRRSSVALVLPFGLLASGSVVGGFFYHRRYEKRYRAKVERQLSAGASGYMLKDRANEELGDAIRTIVSNRTYLSPGIAGMERKNGVSTANSQVKGAQA